MKQELSDAVAIAEKAAARKAISGALVKEGDQLNFVVVVLSGDQMKAVFLEPPRATSKAGRPFLAGTETTTATLPSPAEKGIAAHPVQSVVGALLVGILIGRLPGRH